MDGYFIRCPICQHLMFKCIGSAYYETFFCSYCESVLEVPRFQGSVGGKLR